MSVVLKLGNATATLDEAHARVYCGRDPQACALAFLDAGLSRRHAEVWMQDGQTWIRDLGSSNGTWIDGQMLGPGPVPLRAGAHVYLGTVSLGVEWTGGGATMMVAMPDVLKQLVLARQQQMAVMAAQPAAMPSPMAGPAPMQSAVPIPGSASSAIAGSGVMGLPTEYMYRRQGSNDNGVILLALRQDTFWNGGVIEGYVEFTSTDHQTVASITVELIERHRKGPSAGQVWDRVLVRQGPWRAANGDVLPLPFQLRIPTGTSISGRDVTWDLRGYVDINWATDVACDLPITMRNTDVERVRDALGSLDYRVLDLVSAPTGQRFDGRFQPPANMRAQLGINEIDVAIEYLGANLKVMVHIDKRGAFKGDKDMAEVFDLAKFRSAPMNEVVQHFGQLIQKMMS